MKLRSISNKVTAQRVRMGDVFLDQAIPLPGIDMIDPFLLIHHWKDTLEGGKHQRDVGVGPHPHRGFAPVTFIFKGGVHHRDSLGNSEVVEQGGTQWMHSGNGIVHSERPTKEIAEGGGEFEIIQFWVNVPAEKKMVPAYYHPLSAKDTPKVQSPDKKVDVSVVAGEFMGQQGPVTTHSALLTLRLVIEPGGRMELPLPAEYNALTYTLDGRLNVNGTHDAGAKDLVHFKNDGEGVVLEALEQTNVILLAGRPIEEPVATYGPFVMNTQQELMQAMNDYQNGKMGVLKEEFN